MHGQNLRNTCIQSWNLDVSWWRILMVTTPPLPYTVYIHVYYKRWLITVHMAAVLEKVGVQYVLPFMTGVCMRLLFGYDFPCNFNTAENKIETKELLQKQTKSWSRFSYRWWTASNHFKHTWTDMMTGKVNDSHV